MPTATSRWCSGGSRRSSSAPAGAGLCCRRCAKGCGTAARAAGATRMLAQSIAFRPPGVGRSIAEHERMVLDFDGIVLRYGWLYGSGTYSPEGRLVPQPRIHVDEAARRTVELLDAPTGVVV